jgi:5-deoxy-D-glucuronate isomerase
MNDQEKIQILEETISILKEQISLLKKLHELEMKEKKSNYTPVYPWTNPWTNPIQPIICTAPSTTTSAEITIYNEDANKTTTGKITNKEAISTFKSETAKAMEKFASQGREWY